MIEIAMHSPEKGIYQKDIAINQEISLKYLDHIIHSLKAARLIINVHGKKSGYILARDPSEITVYDIHKAFESGICVVECMVESIVCKRDSICLTKGFWKDLNGLVENYFMSVTLGNLIKDQIEHDILINVN